MSQIGYVRIKDDEGQTCFRLDGIGEKRKEKFTIEEDNGEALYSVEEKVFRFCPEYVIYDKTNTKVAKVKKALPFLKKEFEIEVGQQEWRVLGNEGQYTIKENKRPMLHIQYETGDNNRYIIEIVDKTDVALCLVIGIILIQVI